MVPKVMLIWGNDGLNIRFYVCDFKKAHLCVELRVLVYFACGSAWWGSNFGLLHWLVLSPLQHSRTTVPVCDQGCYGQTIILGWVKV